MSRQPFHTFHISAEVYRNGVNFCLTKDAKRAAKYVAKQMEDDSIVEGDFDCAGKCFHRHGICDVVWLPQFPKTTEEIGTAIHEIFHATYSIMSWAHIPLNQDSEEPYAHLLAYLTRKFFENKP